MLPSVLLATLDFSQVHVKQQPAWGLTKGNYIQLHGFLHFVRDSWRNADKRRNSRFFLLLEVLIWNTREFFLLTPSLKRFSTKTKASPLPMRQPNPGWTPIRYLKVAERTAKCYTSLKCDLKVGRYSKRWLHYPK